MRWAMIGALALLGCGTATNVAPAEGDAGDGGGTEASAVDAGSLEDRQFEAANTLTNEMAEGVREMGTYPTATREPFVTALAAWNSATRAATDSFRSDASLPDRRAADIRIAVGVRFPAYCQMRAAMPDLTPMVVPRIRCSELPVTGAWWERYQTP